MKEFSVTVKPSHIFGTLRAPSSKSMMIRTLAGAWLAEGKTRILYPSFCKDVLNISQALSDNGVIIHKNEDFWEVQGGKDLIPDTVFHVGESGLGARLFIPLASKYHYHVTITGSGSLLNRPVKLIERPMARLGVEMVSRDGYLPVSVKGPFNSGKIEVDGSGGSQFITGLLMALPLARGDSVIEVGNLHSRPYIDLTIEVLKHFNIEVQETARDTFSISGNQQYKATEISVEGDWSGASFLLVAGAVAGSVTVTSLKRDSRQADRKIIEALQKAGLHITFSGNEIRVEKGKILPFSFDITHCPDLAPPLVALGAYAKGISVLSGVKRLFTKESNRAETLKSEAAQLGIKIEQKDDTLLVHGGRVTGGNVHAHNDHRIAMAASVMALGAEKAVVINHAECVDKSYPGFFNDLKKIGGTIHESIR